MAAGKELSGAVEWRETKLDGTSAKIVPESGLLERVCKSLQGRVSKISRFLEKAWSIGVSDPKKVIHCVKVGLALSLVSLFYYMRPLYEGVGGNAMWAVMTVVVVFEYTVGATLCKCINRATGTLLAGSLGIGVHWVATQSGERFEPIIIGLSVFLLASATTFSRFIPSIKARFDYGALIFILTFSLVSVSGFRVDHKLFDMAHQRLSTVLIGTSICLLISMFFCPVWAGIELHLLIHRNMEKLADSLDGCLAEFFKENNGNDNTVDEQSNKKMQGYKCTLNSKTAEESMANFARWEPSHGAFNFGHPWKQYLKIGAAMRGCACCIESLSSCIDPEVQVPGSVKNNFREVCIRVSSHSSKVLKELVVTMKTMTKSSTTDLTVGEMNFAVQELQNALKSLPIQLLFPTISANNATAETTTEQFAVPLIKILPLATAMSLLIEIAARIEGIVDQVDELADLAEFKPAADNKSKQGQSAIENIDDETMKILQKV
ncbi:aluminum-activated malate transporter 10 [Diospyros lotus]|uniref:aluminum-activated malate transporter 10 n=1 Tax=Diospyros lotus TaxID=55363 RepID=UPI002259B94B|nr:aluminum-activated malate transporter 10 [Diospyros lotus]